MSRKLTKNKILTDLDHSQTRIAVLEARIAQLEATGAGSADAEVAAWGAETWFHGALQFATHAVLIIDSNRRIVFWNQGAENVFGYSADEMVGQPLGNIVPERFCQQFEAVLSDPPASAGHSGRSFVTYGRRHDGSEFPFEISLASWRQNGGYLNSAIIRDVTDQKKALRENQQGTDDISLINRLNDASNRGESLQQILQFISDESRLIFASNGASIFLLDEDGKNLVMQKTDTKDSISRRVEKIIGRSLDSMEIKASLAPGTFVAQVIQDGKPRLIDDPDMIKGLLSELTDSRLLKKLVPTIYKVMEMGSVIVVPLIAQQKIIGVMTIARMQPFDESVVQRIKNISEQMTVIISHKRSEEALAESEARYRNLVETSPDAIALSDLRGRIKFANQKAANLFGYEQVDEALGKNLLNFVVKADRSRAIKDIRKALGQKSIKNAEYTFIRRDGSTFPGEISGTLIDNARGQPATLMGIMRDISERKNSEAALVESEERYRSLVETSPDAIAISDLKGRVQFANQQAAVFYGYRHPDELIGKNGLDAIAPADRPRVTESLRHLTEKGIIKNIEHTSIKQDGTASPAEISVSMVRDARGKPTALVGVVRDITERKQAEEERRQSIEGLRRAIGGTIQAITLTVESRDPYTAGHQQRVADLARSIAVELGLERNQIEGIRMAGAIHDLGKIHIPSEILSKPTQLSDMDMTFIKSHSQAGYDILKEIEFLWPVAQIVLQHHERMDGSGYPGHLSGKDILPEARILAVADVVEAMASHRPYRPAFGIDMALDEINRNQGVLYDSRVVEACLRLFREKGLTLTETPGALGTYSRPS